MFDFSVEATVTASLSSKGAFVSPPAEVTYLGPAASPPEDDDLHMMDQRFVVRSYHAVTLAFVGSGLIGVAEFYATMAAITNAFVLIGMATFFVDFLGAFISDTFSDDRYEDDGERLGLEAMLASLADNGVPFNPEHLRLPNADGTMGDSYEETLLRMRAQLVRLDAMWRTKLPLEDDRLEDVKQRFKEARERDFPNGDRYSSKFKLKRLPDSQQRNDRSEVFLVAGENVLGRGMGNCVISTISRAQIFCFLDDRAPEPIKIRSLRGAAEQSTPGYRRQGESWKVLSAGEVVDLKEDDLIALQIRWVKDSRRPHLNGVFRVMSHTPEEVANEDDGGNEWWSWLIPKTASWPDGTAKV